MAIQVSEYIDVKARALELGCNPPSGLALLPRNFDTANSKEELVHESSTPEVRALWREAGIVETRIEKEGDKFPYAQDKVFDWLGPVIFISVSLWSQDPNAVSVALSIVSNYLTDFFKGIPNADRTGKLDIVVQKSTEEYELYHYEGHVDGLREIETIIHEIKSHE